MTLGSASAWESLSIDDEGYPAPPSSPRHDHIGDDRCASAPWTSITINTDRPRDTQPILSRAIDIVGALLILTVAFPFLLILAALLLLDSPGPLFFAQQRIGRDGRAFPCLKFRTMCRNADQALQLHLAASNAARAEWARDHKLRDDPRITRLGKIVRKLSLDEFPQLINILRGEMSLVGPRPIIRSEAIRYGRYFDEYCRVKPGLTGLWQVSGRNNVTYRRRVSLDCYYVRNKNVLMDLMILFRTIPAVLSAKGSY